MSVFNGKMLRILVFNTHSQRLVRACVDAVTATYTLTAVGGYGRIDIHFAGFCTRIAAGAFALVKAYAVQGDPVEEAVYRAERAEVFAERSVDDEASGKYQSEDNELQAEQRSKLIRDLLVCCGKPEAGYGPGRADILAEERRELEAEREEQDKQREHGIFEKAEIFIEFEFVFLEERYLVQKILKESERTEKSAYRAPKKGTCEDQESGHIVGDPELHSAQV